MSKTDVGQILSPCCGVPFRFVIYPDMGGSDAYLDEIQCTNCSNLWDEDGRFVSF